MNPHHLCWLSKTSNPTLLTTLEVMLPVGILNSFWNTKLLVRILNSYWNTNLHYTACLYLTGICCEKVHQQSYSTPGFGSHQAVTVDSA